jgi:hypothetical protein
MQTQITFKTDLATLLNVPDCNPYILLYRIGLSGNLKTQDATTIRLTYASELEETKTFYGTFNWLINKKVYSVKITFSADSERVGFVTLEYDGTPIPDAYIGVDSEMYSNVNPTVSSTTQLYMEDTLTTNDEKTIKEVTGRGETEYIDVHVEAATKSEHVQIRVYCDNLIAFGWDFFSMQKLGFSCDTPSISLLSYTLDGQCVCLITTKFIFKRKLKITLKRYPDSPTQTVKVEGLVNIMA